MARRFVQDKRLISFISLNSIENTCDPLRQKLGYFNSLKTLRPRDPDDPSPSPVSYRALTGLGDHAILRDEHQYFYYELPSLNYPHRFTDADRVLEGVNQYNAYSLDSDNNEIENVRYNPDLVKTNFETRPTVSFPVRLVGNENLIVNQSQWQKIILGGTFLSASYPTLYNNQVYNLFELHIDFGYDTFDAKKNKLYGAMNDLETISVETNYSSYIPNYQNEIEGIHERLLPNFNLMTTVYLEKEQDHSRYNPEVQLAQPVYKYIAWSQDEYDKIFTRHGLAGHATRDVPPRYFNSNDRSSPTSTAAGTLTVSEYSDANFYTNRYLTASFLQTNLSTEEKQYVNNANKLILHTTGGLDIITRAHIANLDGRGIANHFPYHVKIKIPTPKSTTNPSNRYTNFLASNDLQEEVLSYIYDTFTNAGGQGGVVEQLPVSKIETKYHYDEMLLTSSAFSKEPMHMNLLAFDVPKMLVNISNKNTQTNNNIIISDNQQEIAKMKNSDSSFRYSKSYPAQSALDDIMTRMKNLLMNNFLPAGTGGTTRDDYRTTAPRHDPSSFFDILRRLDVNTNSTSYLGGSPRELLAYRVTKRKGSPVSTAGVSETIQSFMFFHEGKSADPDIIFNDMQVKYGEDYTYEFYAYYMVPGFRYRYNNLRISRQIGELTAFGSAYDRTPGNEGLCLEFFDPFTGLTANQLMAEQSNLKSISKKPRIDPSTFFTNDSKGKYFNWVGVTGDSNPSNGQFGTIPQIEYAWTPGIADSTGIYNAPEQIQAFIFYLLKEIYLMHNTTIIEKVARALNISINLIIDWEDAYLGYTGNTEDGDPGRIIIAAADATMYESAAAPDWAYTGVGGFEGRTVFRRVGGAAVYDDTALGDAKYDMYELFFAYLDAAADRTPSAFIDLYYEFCENYPEYLVEIDSIGSLEPGYHSGTSFLGRLGSTSTTDVHTLTIQYILEGILTKLSLGTTVSMIDTRNIASASATNAQIKSHYRYLADLNIEIEPTLKIVQVPVTTKTISILDNPPVACDVTPYFKKDNSQTVGFFINKEAFPRFTNQYDTFNSKVNTYPTPVSQFEQDIKDRYMITHDLSSDEFIKKNSVSPVETVVVYRLAHEPSSLSEFDQNIVATKQLSNDTDSSYSYSNCFYEEQIATNKKMYYLFKFVNKNGIIGHTSPVQEVELIDDGGYKYINVNTIDEQDLGQKNKKVISTEFKKLMQIKLQPSQTILNYENVDLTNNPDAEKNNIVVGNSQNPVWGKRYKFRITSKKTGKKLDLNVKYVLRK